METANAKATNNLASRECKVTTLLSSYIVKPETRQGRSSPGTTLGGLRQGPLGEDCVGVVFVVVPHGCVHDRSSDHASHRHHIGSRGMPLMAHLVH